MATLEYWDMDDRALEEYADHVKCVVLAALVLDGKLTHKDAEDWAGSHTVIRRKKSFFRTISDLFDKTEESERRYLIVVKSV